MDITSNTGAAVGSVQGASGCLCGKRPSCAKLGFHHRTASNPWVSNPAFGSTVLLVLVDTLDTRCVRSNACLAHAFPLFRAVTLPRREIVPTYLIYRAIVRSFCHALAFGHGKENAYLSASANIVPSHPPLVFALEAKKACLFRVLDFIVLLHP